MSKKPWELYEIYTLILLFCSASGLLFAYLSPNVKPRSPEQKKEQPEEVEESSSREYLSISPALTKDEETLDMELLSSIYIPQMGVAQKLRVGANTFDTFICWLDVTQLSFFHKNPKGKQFKSFWTLKKYLDTQNTPLRFATNGGIFKPTYNPEGLYVENGKEYFPLNTKPGKGNFYMKPNGVFFVTRYGTANVTATANYPKIKSVVRHATQSGPMLVRNSQINPKFRPPSKSKYIRNGVGIIEGQQVVFVISNQPVNFYDFARVFKAVFRCKNALYLDGAISKMYIPPLKRYELEGDFGIIIGISQQANEKTDHIFRN
ncbi:MAG: phosphodiester glycosidase family protein [Bacteroidota bacterium]